MTVSYRIWMRIIREIVVLGSKNPYMSEEKKREKAMKICIKILKELKIDEWREKLTILSISVSED